jgi:hypothetical protein
VDDPLRSTIETARSIGFGGLIGVGIGAIIYLHMYGSFDYFRFREAAIFLGISGVIGIGCQHAIERVLGFVFQPVFGYVRFRLKLLEIDRLVKTHRISAEEGKNLILKLCEKRLLE